jgi:hypothetical protein
MEARRVFRPRGVLRHFRRPRLRDPAAVLVLGLFGEILRFPCASVIDTVTLAVLGSVKGRQHAYNLTYAHLRLAA